MRFALLGDHPDGLNMARALVASGRHEWVSYNAHPTTTEFIARSHLNSKPVPDIEEILADPAVAVLIVAGGPTDRAVQLRRCLQAERHVLCVHPPDDAPDSAYEAAMIQGDTHCLLLPLLPDSLHPGLLRLSELTGEGTLGMLTVLAGEWKSRGDALLDGQIPGHKPSIPGWDILRLLGGEIAEVWGFAEKEETDAHAPLIVAGRFDKGGVFHARFLPKQSEDIVTIRVTGTLGEAELIFPGGVRGAARLLRTGTSEEHWETWDPWPAMVRVFESALATPETKSRSLISWPSEIRNLELDDAARRSVQRRRASTLEYPEATEEVGFKGTMTLFGCAILWVILFLAILSAWMPRVGWLIVPILVIFLGLQLLRWIVPREKGR
jgi:predicted dehydrogenase